MEVGRLEIERGQFCIGDLDASRIHASVQFGANLQACAAGASPLDGKGLGVSVWNASLPRSISSRPTSMASGTTPSCQCARKLDHVIFARRLTGRPGLAQVLLNRSRQKHSAPQAVVGGTHRGAVRVRTRRAAEFWVVCDTSPWASPLGVSHQGRRAAIRSSRRGLCTSALVSNLPEGTPATSCSAAHAAPVHEATKGFNPERGAIP